ncbi:MAG: sulfite exporter TauE/SafE family protein [Verrucomicrobiales bacterium]
MVKLILIGLGIGAVSGAVAALCGVGGGIILVPAFAYFLGLSHKAAVATSLAVIIPTAIAATVKNHSNTLVDWKVALATSVGAIVLAWFAADALKTWDTLFLKRIFAVVLLLVGLKMLFEK